MSHRISINYIVTIDGMAVCTHCYFRPGCDTACLAMPGSLCGAVRTTAVLDALLLWWTLEREQFRWEELCFRGFSSQLDDPSHCELRQCWNGVVGGGGLFHDSQGVEQAIGSRDKVNASKHVLKYLSPPFHLVFTASKLMPSKYESPCGLAPWLDGSVVRFVH